jgi:hypothetical protein
MRDNDIVAFTVRIPRELKDQIDTRAAIHRRVRNAEILVLLEHGIDSSVDQDLQVVKRYDNPR